MRRCTTSDGALSTLPFYPDGIAASLTVFDVEELRDDKMVALLVLVNDAESTAPSGIANMSQHAARARVESHWSTNDADHDESGWQPCQMRIRTCCWSQCCKQSTCAVADVINGQRTEQLRTMGTLLCPAAKGVDRPRRLRLRAAGGHHSTPTTTIRLCYNDDGSSDSSSGGSSSMISSSKTHGLSLGVCVRPLYTSSRMTGFRPEAAILHTWIAYHTQMGADRLYLHDRPSEPNASHSVPTLRALVEPELARNARARAIVRVKTVAHIAGVLAYRQYNDQYDQLIVMAGCLMNARRDGLAFVLNADYDEYVQFAPHHASFHDAMWMALRACGDGGHHHESGNHLAAASSTTTTATNTRVFASAGLWLQRATVSNASRPGGLRGAFDFINGKTILSSRLAALPLESGYSVHKICEAGAMPQGVRAPMKCKAGPNELWLDHLVDAYSPRSGSMLSTVLAPAQVQVDRDRSKA